MVYAFDLLALDDEVLLERPLPSGASGSWLCSAAGC